MGKSVDAAVDAHAELEALYNEGARVTPEQAARGRAKIHSAASKILVELRQDEGTLDQYDEILERWDGDEGLYRKFRENRFSEVYPAFMDQFIADLREAAWLLGYLQAGKKTQDGIKIDDSTKAQNEVRQMMSD